MGESEMNETEFVPDFDGDNLPEGFTMLTKCVRASTDTVLVLKVPKHITPNTFPDWCCEEVPVGFHPSDVCWASDDQLEAMGY
jgi:hypothetical protein